MKTLAKLTAAALAAALIVILALNTHFTFGVVLDGAMNGRIFTRSPYNYISYEDTIAGLDSWDADLCRDLCYRANLLDEWCDADADDAEKLIYAAAEKLGVEI